MLWRRGFTAIPRSLNVGFILAPSFKVQTVVISKNHRCISSIIISNISITNKDHLKSNTALKSVTHNPNSTKWNSNYLLDHVRSYTRRLTRTTGHGVNTHRSNRAKEGLYHGRDVRSGHQISFSKKKNKRKWYPNVQKKRLWSETLDHWVKFNITTVAMKAVDHYGGIDNYVLALDEKSVADSNYITKMRRIIAASRFLKGTLDKKLTKTLGFDVQPPTPADAIYAPRPSIPPKRQFNPYGKFADFYKNKKDLRRG